MQNSFLDPLALDSSFLNASPLTPCREWFDGHAIQVQPLRATVRIDNDLDHIARFIGERYDQVSPLLKACKQAINGSGMTSISLASASAVTINDCCQLAANLHRRNMLRSYQYDRRSRQLFTQPPVNNRVAHFLTGGWFERFIQMQVKGYMADRSISATVQSNLHIVAPTGATYELDLFVIAGSRPILIECTTGSCSAHLRRLHEKSQLLHLTKQQTILVSAHSSDAYVRTQTATQPVTFTNRRHFLYALNEALQA